MGKCAYKIMEEGSCNTTVNPERGERMTLKLSRKTDVLNKET
jgi:hypothetical protein